MAVIHELTHRSCSNGNAGLALEDRFEVLKEIGDGSFGSVVLARVRAAGASVARRGTVIAIKTMKKSFESFAPCLELREVVFLQTLPAHAHLVPALDIFLDPLSKKLHIAMEYMESNLYQLMKARDHKCLDNASVKSVLFQIMQGLEHIHAHGFFHRDIKPENILVSTCSHQESGNSFRRYSALVAPPATPPSYTVKIADFGLARETQSKLPYTTYVSTRWYRAPEVLLRAGEYSAPVDIWAVGAMAVEVATLKPLFPGGNEVDQIWRVCEIMGSPGNWYSKTGQRVGGGNWKDGARLAGKLGFSFPKMAPHSMDTILLTSQWPSSLSQFVTWCLTWDPKSRPTSTQALAHEYFADAVDPLGPKSSSSKILGRKQSDLGKVKDSGASTLASSRPWFRKSLTVPSQSAAREIVAPHPSLNPVAAEITALMPKAAPSKRATWANGTCNVAPMPILPTIRPISPLSDAVTAQAAARKVPVEEKSRKIGRQLSVASSTNQYAEIHRQQAERALNGNSGLASPPSGHQKESFFSHLRKRARRFSGRHQTPISPTYDDMETQAVCGAWASSNHLYRAMDSQPPPPLAKGKFESTGKSVREVQQQTLETSAHPAHQAEHGKLKRHHSLPHHQPRSVESLVGAARVAGPVSSRTRRAQAIQGVYQYDAPDEEDELLDEVLSCTQRAINRLEKKPSKALQHSASNVGFSNPYPTPSPSANGHAMLFGSEGHEAHRPRPLDFNKKTSEHKWPTPPYDENDWAASASASIWAASHRF